MLAAINRNETPKRVIAFRGHFCPRTGHWPWAAISLGVTVKGFMDLPGYPLYGVNPVLHSGLSSG
jgi:hypothetical protein